MHIEQTKNYQTFLLFFSWTVGLLAVATTMFFYIEITLTPIILGFLLLDIIINLRNSSKNLNRHFYNAFFLIILLFGWIIFSNIYSPSLEYKYEKTYRFIANIIFFLYPFYIKKINFELLIKLYCIIVLPISSYFIFLSSIVWSGGTKQLEVFMELRGAYLTIGLHLGILFLLLLFFKKNIYLKIGTFFLLMASSARGPLLFTVITALLYYFIKKDPVRSFNPKHLLRIVLAGVISFIIYFIKSDMIDSLMFNSIKRFTSLGSGNDGSALERIRRLDFALNSPFNDISTFLFGNGIGSFGILYEKIDKKSYPHNILLESFFELGFVGWLLLLFLISIPFSKLKIRTDVFSILFLFLFFNAMKSSNITDLYLLFSVMGGLIVMLNYRKTSH